MGRSVVNSEAIKNRCSNHFRSVAKNFLKSFFQTCLVQSHRSMQFDQKVPWAPIHFLLKFAEKNTRKDFRTKWWTLMNLLTNVPKDGKLWLTKKKVNFIKWPNLTVKDSVLK